MVDLPAEEVPPELPGAAYYLPGQADFHPAPFGLRLLTVCCVGTAEPALGINFARNGMQARTLSLLRRARDLRVGGVIWC